MATLAGTTASALTLVQRERPMVTERRRPTDGETPATLASASRVKGSRLGLALDDSMSFAGWRAVGERIATHADSSSWWLGDWLIFGEDHYGPRYTKAIALTGLGYKTLRNYAVVARRFEMSRRRDTLSFQHHAEVAALDDAEQDHWLDLAQQSKWSKAELRRRVRDRRVSSSDRGLAPVKLRVSVEGMQRWRAAAARCQCDLYEWMVRTLDSAADEAASRDGPMK